MPSKSQNYIEIAYKMLEENIFEMKNFKVLKIAPNVNRWCGIVLRVFPGSRNAIPMIFGYSKLVFEKKSKFEIRLENVFSACEAEFSS